MNKYIILVVYLLGICASAFAQVQHEHSSCVEDSIGPLKETVLTEVVVTGLTGAERMKDSPIAFSVISPKQWHQSMGTNIVDMIANTPGLSHISTGVGISKPVIRGLGYNRVVVVEQGIRHEGQQWGDEHGLEVDAEGVHSVEILKGPASLMYGSDAIAGVLILHPERPLEEGIIQTKVGGEYQSNNGLYNYHVGFSGNVKGWLWNCHYNDRAAHCYKNRIDGYVPGSWYKERDVQGMTGIQKRWGHSYLRFSHVDFTPGITEGERDEDTNKLVWEEDNAPKVYYNQMPFQRVLHTKVVSDNLWYLKQGSLKTIIGYQQNYRREFEESLQEAELEMRLHTINYDVCYKLSLDHDWKIATGVNGMWQQNQNEAEEMLIPNYSLFDIGYFFTIKKKIGSWHLSGGARIDDRYLSVKKAEAEGKVKFSDFTKNFIGIVGSLGSVYNVNDRLNLRFNIASGFRAPTVSELCSDGVHEGSIQYEIGNHDLKSEYSMQVDFGLDFHSRYLSLTTSLFGNWIQNYIFLSRLSYDIDGYRAYQYHQGNAILLGGEISVDVKPINALHIENAFSYIRGLQLHQPSKKRNLPMIPAPRWSCNLRYEFPDFAHNYCRHSYVGIGVDFNFRQNHFYAFEGTETSTPSYAIFNLSAGMDLHIFGHNCIEITLVCHNLFNKNYQSHLSRLKYADDPGISAMGRNVCIKLNIPIDFHLKKYAVKE